MRLFHLVSSFVVIAASIGCRAQVIDDGGTGSMDTNTDSGTNDAAGPVGPVGVAIAPATPNALASDGTTLFWTSFGGALQSTPITGGPISTLDPGPVGEGLLAVDDVNVYYIGDGNRIAKVTKTGGATSYITVASVQQATVLGSTLYWV
ncbi:MAG TPA: hypothetical protein VK841_26705 [Polyangiaceae bacterium]|jgi:hypothetical protein|nr:hypothetical protein [Polyangiaceae bacterium]